MTRDLKTLSQVLLLSLLFVGCKTIQPMDKIIEVEKQVEVIVEKQAEIVNEVELLPDSPQKEIVKTKVVEQVNEIEKLVYIVSEAKEETTKLIGQNQKLEATIKNVKAQRNYLAILLSAIILIIILLVSLKILRK